MTRLPRFESLPEFGMFHVTSRGVARQSIAADDLDRVRWSTQLHDARRRFGWKLLAYCLMPNHFHLVVLTGLEELSRGMHRLNFLYAQRYNERHDRVGHLFQGRFGARVVDGDAHLASVCDYVLDNAVRAGLCARRADWRWCGGELAGYYAGA